MASESPTGDHATLDAPSSPSILSCRHTSPVSAKWICEEVAQNGARAVKPILAHMARRKEMRNAPTFGYTGPHGQGAYRHNHLTGRYISLLLTRKYQKYEYEETDLLYGRKRF